MKTEFSCSLVFLCILLTGCHNDDVKQYKKQLYYEKISFSNGQEMNGFLDELSSILNDFGYTRDERANYEEAVSFTPDREYPHKLFVKRINNDFGAFLILFDPSSSKLRLIFQYSVYTPRGKNPSHQQMDFQMDEKELRKRVPKLKVSR